MNRKEIHKALQKDLMMFNSRHGENRLQYECRYHVEKETGLEELRVTVSLDYNEEK